MSPARRRRMNFARPFLRRTHPGAGPGVIQSDPDAPPPQIRVIRFGPEDFEDQMLDSCRELPALLGQSPVTWVNVDGVGDADVIRQLAEIFGIHALAVEDVVNVHQRAKVEAYDDHLFIVVRIVAFNSELYSEQVSLFLGPNYLLTFQEGIPGDCWENVRERLKKGHGRIHHQGPDHLTYALLDAVIDAYFPVLENIGERIDQIEERVMSRANRQLIADVHQVRRDLLFLRRTLWPHREAINALVRDEHPLVTAETRVFLRDCYDHAIQLIEVSEMYREMCSDLRDFHFSQINDRTNEVMKVLTIIATLFMPLSFIAGVYGMNFDPEVSPWNMPELKWFFGYPFSLGLMLVTVCGFLYFLWRRGWLRD